MKFNYEKNLAIFIFIGGFLGYLFGTQITWNADGSFVEVITILKDTFISALKMLVAPMVFLSLLKAILDLKKQSNMSKLFGRTIGYYLLTTALAIVVGLVAVYIFQPWNMESTLQDLPRSEVKSFISDDNSGYVAIFTKIFSRIFVNPVQAFVDNNILALLFLAILLGLALNKTVSSKHPIRETVDALNSGIFKILSWVIAIAPVGVFALMFLFSLEGGNQIAAQLATFCLVVFLATMFHGLIVLPSIAWIFAKVSPIYLLKNITKAMMLAFSTSSSSATLPVTIETCEDNLDIDPKVAAFVCPMGATMNMDGTALFEGIAAIFIANLYGMTLSAPAMAALFIMTMLASIGAPGMPSASMGGMQMVLLAAGLPLEAIGILLVVERFLDTFRTAVNVEGDIIGALIIDRNTKFK